MKQCQKSTGRTEGAPDKRSWDSYTKTEVVEGMVTLPYPCAAHTEPSGWRERQWARLQPSPSRDGCPVTLQALCPAWWSWRFTTPPWHLQMLMRVTDNTWQARIRKGTKVRRPSRTRLSKLSSRKENPYQKWVTINIWLNAECHRLSQPGSNLAVN